MSSPRKRVLLVCLGVFAGIVIAIRIGGHYEPFWRFVIPVLGERSSYELLVVSVKGEPLIEQHAAAHRFGEALYTLRGIEGITVCDPSLFYGCFHQIIGQGFSEHGMGVVKHVVDACSPRPAGLAACMHSLGHGVLASIGHELEDVRVALSICREVSGTIDPREVCAAGVFMEFIFRTMIQPGVEERPLTNDLYSPCNALNDMTDKQARWCIFWLPQWWGEHSTDNAMFGTLCAVFAGVEKADCYNGIGKRTVWYRDASARKSVDSCEESTVDEALRSLCAYGAAFEIYSSGSVNDALEICKLIGAKYRNMCLQYAQGKRMTPDFTLNDSDV